MSYHSVYGTAHAPTVTGPTVYVDQGDMRRTFTPPAYKINRSDRQVVMTIKRPGKAEEHVITKVELVIPVCPDCTAQHRGECY